MITATRTPRARARKLGQVPVRVARLADIHPSPENNRLYRPIDAKDPDVLALADSIRRHGVREPLVVTTDSYILSGHRRHVAARLAGLTKVPVRIVPIRRADDMDRFIVLLREHNRQRTKSLDEVVREELVTTNPDAAYKELLSQREERAAIRPDAMEIVGRAHRCEITDAKAPLLNAVRKVLDDLREFWPVSVRKIHYALLNNPPLKHASKPNSRYANDLASYKAMDELVTRARIEYVLPFDCIADETRPVTVWDVHRDPRSFIRKELDDFLSGYWRDRQQSQPNWIEIIGEKNAIASILRPVASDFCIPLTLGRGYCSLPPRYDMAKRFRASGREKLVLLIVSDFDPEGEEIAQSFARSMRDDFGIANIHPVKVALTAEQVEEYGLPPQMKAKMTSAQYGKFIRRYGNDDVFEVDAMDPPDLQEVLREAIRGVMDIDAYNAETEAEKRDAAFLQAARKTAIEALKDIGKGAE